MKKFIIVVAIIAAAMAHETEIKRRVTSYSAGYDRKFFLKLQIFYFNIFLLFILLKTKRQRNPALVPELL